MELDLHSLFGLLCTLYSLDETPQLPPPAFGLIYDGAVGQPRRVLFVTPWYIPTSVYYLKISYHGV